MPTILIRLNKIPHISFMAVFATSLSEPRVRARARVRARGRVRGRARGRGRGRTRLRVGVGVSVRVGLKNSVGGQSGQTFLSGAFGAHRASDTFGAHGLLGRCLWHLTVGWRPPKGGHEATDTGLAYAPVSQAHGHHHTQFNVLPCCTAAQTTSVPNVALHAPKGGGRGSWCPRTCGVASPVIEPNTQG